MLGTRDADFNHMHIKVAFGSGICARSGNWQPFSVKGSRVNILGFKGQTIFIGHTSVAKTGIDSMRMNEHDCFNKTLFIETEFKCHVIFMSQNIFYFYMFLVI